jgi:4-amino-4-deoxychorismate lyase
MPSESAFKNLNYQPFSLENLVEANRRQLTASRQSMRWMYSSFFGGWTKDPALMMLPMDDHGFHRGDAVFEAIKFKKRRAYLMKEHLLRLQRSALRIGLDIPWRMAQIEEVLMEGLREVEDCLTMGLLRIFVTRGPGDFSPNPYSTLGSQLYCVITDLAPMKDDWIKRGCRVGVSGISVKPSPFPQIKSCNYLPNVLMKKEAVDRGLDFVISLDASGFLAESATENFAWIDDEGALCVPRSHNILDGCTLVRVMELAKSCGIKVREQDATPEQLSSAKGALMIGTTIDVIPVEHFVLSDLIPKQISWNTVDPVIFLLRKKILGEQ